MQDASKVHQDESRFKVKLNAKVHSAESNQAPTWFLPTVQSTQRLCLAGVICGGPHIRRHSAQQEDPGVAHHAGGSGAGHRAGHPAAPPGMFCHTSAEAPLSMCHSGSMTSPSLSHALPLASCAVIQFPFYTVHMGHSVVQSVN